MILDTYIGYPLLCCLGHPGQSIQFNYQRGVYLGKKGWNKIAYISNPTVEEWLHDECERNDGVVLDDERYYVDDKTMTMMLLKWVGVEM